MPNDGKDLEALVAFVERQLLPKGFEVKTNSRTFADGVPVAEFDVEIRGKVGSTELAWLIECRDRPSHGPAPGSWIEQLVGRRGRFGFNKVTAVSTTGFAQGVRDYAKQSDIELREVKALTPDQFTWLRLEHIRMRVREYRLIGCGFRIAPDIPKEILDAYAAAMQNRLNGHENILHASDGSKVVSVYDALMGVVHRNREFGEGPPRVLNILSEYPNDQSHYVVKTPKGAIRIRAIHFVAEMTLTEEFIPFEAVEYRKLEESTPISQRASAKFSIDDKKFALDLDRISGSEATRITMRKVE